MRTLGAASSATCALHAVASEANTSMPSTEECAPAILRAQSLHLTHRIDKKNSRQGVHMLNSSGRLQTEALRDVWHLQIVPPP